MPGIINGHGHVGPPPRDPQLRQYALYGVTTTTSMYFDQDDVAAIQGAAEGRRLARRAHPHRDVPLHVGAVQARLGEQDARGGRAKVDEIAAKGADFVKVWIDAQGGRYPKLTPEFTAAVMDQARKHDKISMAHIVELADARRIVDAGRQYPRPQRARPGHPGRFHRHAEGEERLGDLDARPRGGAVRLRRRRNGPLHRQPVLPEGADAGAAGAAQDQEARGAGQRSGPPALARACSTPTRRT